MNVNSMSVKKEVNQLTPQILDGKKLGIMQPYFFPYIGYFQLIAAVDLFVIYDNIKYTKKGWINRNRILLNGHDTLISLPLKSDSDLKMIVDREISTEFCPQKMMSRLNAAYSKAPYWKQSLPVLDSIFSCPNRNLFYFLKNSLVSLCSHLGIKTEIVVSSAVDINHDLKGQDKVISICKKLEAVHYINAPGGADLYSKKTFLEHQLQIHFIQPTSRPYSQFSNQFVPWLSIIDVMMFNSSEQISQYLHDVTYLS